MASIQKRAKPHYRVQVPLKGHYRSATFPSWAQARCWATQTEQAIYEMRPFPVTEASRHTLRELLARYGREVLPRKRPGIQAHRAQQLAWWQQQRGHLRLDRPTPARLTACRERLWPWCQAVTVNQYPGQRLHAAADPSWRPACWGTRIWSIYYMPCPPQV
jgi:hypothetical protein